MFKIEAIRPIKNEEGYKITLKQMESLFHAKPNTQEGDILALLALVIEDYENKYYKIEALSPLEALKYEMEE